MLGTIIIFVVILGLLVFVHELGHFITAKRMGVAVEEFGFGFPPRIIGIKRGGTVYSLNWVPLGGFVKIKGEEGEGGSEPDSFAHKKPWQRVSILAAGVLMNFVLAFVLFSVGFMWGTPQEVTDADINERQVRELSILIIEVAAGSPAEQAGVRVGDKLAAIDGAVFADIDEASGYIAANSSRTLTITLKRGDQPVSLQAKPSLFGGNERPLLGVAFIRSGIVRYGFFESWYRGAIATIRVIIMVVVALAGLLYGLLTGAGVGNQVSGPVGVAVLTGQVAQLGLPYLLNFTAILSVNLGILNIIPFPALDGGRVLFVLLGKIKGRAVRPSFERAMHAIGFGVLITLVVFVTYRDLLRYGREILMGIKSLIG